MAVKQTLSQIKAFSYETYDAQGALDMVTAKANVYLAQEFLFHDVVQVFTSVQPTKGNQWLAILTVVVSKG